MRRNELGLRFLFKLRSNPKYLESLVILNNSEGYNYEENERATRPTREHFRILEQRYMEEHYDTISTTVI